MIRDRFPRALSPGPPRVAVSALLVASAALVGAPALMSGGPGRTVTGPSAAGPPLPVEQPRHAATERLLRTAREQIGIRENAEGGGTKFHSWYMGTERAWETAARDGHSVQAYVNAPWCAMFVSWVAEQVGMRPMTGSDVYVVTWARRFQLDGRWGAAPAPGAIVFFDVDGRGGPGEDVYRIDHMGLVEKDNGDGTITTIEGNTDNGLVERRVRHEDEIVGYGYPDYPVIWGPRSGAPARAAGAGW
ncbi:CHAP domain-containing protein [Planomonospora corallina]|uniref:CHAP domain-containing protein n=1 Tax=Planomonospora corallina TaxID=1806052 RepID=A0ABV8IBF9_9ACTN